MTNGIKIKDSKERKRNVKSGIEDWEIRKKNIIKKY